MDSTTTQTAAAAGFLGASIMMIMLAFAVFYVLLIVARWKVFTKAGVEGWKSIIPIYSDYIEWKLSWNNINMFWISLGLIIVGAILNSVNTSMAISAGGDAPAGGFLSILASLAMLAGAILSLVAKFKLFQAFGKSVGFFIGYIFVPNIMMLILGFGSAQYQGPQD